MSPYRITPPKDPPNERNPFHQVHLFAAVLLLAAAVRVVVAIVAQERCGTEVGIATVLMMMAGRGLFRTDRG